jgi:hypothetical protein
VGIRKAFPLGDVLAVYTGIVLPIKEHDSPLDAFFGVVEHLTGQYLLLPNMRILLEPSAAELVRQHPFLADVEAPKIGNGETPEHYTDITLPSWMDRMVRRHGPTVEVEQRAGEFPQCGPLDGMPEDMKVIVVKMEG